MLSKRLRGKSLMSVNEIPLLFRVVNVVKRMDFIDEITVATTDLIADDPLESAVKDLNVKLFRGDSLNVLNRFTEAADDLDEHDTIVRFTADNPLYSPSISTEVYKKHLDAKADYTHIDGLSHVVPEFFTVAAIREADKLTNSNFDKEHVTPFFRKNTHLFKVLKLPNDFEGLRPDLDPYFTIDTNDQLNAFEAMLSALDYDNKAVHLPQLYQYLDTIKHQPHTDKLRIKLHNTYVGEDYPTYLIAEIGQAHDGSLGILHSYIDAIAETGVDAIKFQTHIAAAESSKHEPFRVNFSYEDKTRFDYWKRMEFTKEQWKEIKSHCDDVGLEFMSSPFSNAAVDLLEEIGVKRYKVGSGEVNNFLLLEKIVRTKKPIIISSGMSSYEELDKTVEFLKRNNADISILQCTTSYPTQPEQYGLNVIGELKERYNVPVGFSDHSAKMETCIAAATLGAEILEFHTTFSRGIFGPDAKSSLTIDELKKMVIAIRNIKKALEHPIDKNDNSKFEALKNIFEKSLSVNKDLPAGAIIKFDDLEAKKPKGYGILASQFNEVIGKKLKRNLKTWEFLNEKDLV
ncbi:MAG: hypothetical protein CSA39_04345 [Flavobacteriales bacterium]|nr:MAG: hypothetical protein CSA39_04345 [Flavobacteriales bacterium]